MLAEHRFNLSQHIVSNLLPMVVMEEIRASRLGSRVNVATPLSWSFDQVS